MIVEFLGFYLLKVSKSIVPVLCCRLLVNFLFPSAQPVTDSVTFAAQM